MALKVGMGYVEIVGDTKPLEGSISRARSLVTDRVGKLSTRIRDSLTKAFSVGGATRALKASLKGVGGIIGGLTKSLFSFKGILTGIVTGFGVAKLAAGFIETGSAMDQLKISLDTITKGRGEEYFNKLNEWALTMPINTEKAIQAFTMMNAMGLEPTIGNMTTLVDTVGALGGGSEALSGIARQLGQIVTKNKVTMEDLSTLAERGVPALEILQQKFNLTDDQLGNIAKSGIDARQAVQAIFEGLDERFGGMSSKLQSKWVGLTETLKSYWVEFQRLVAQSGVMEYLEGRLKVLTDKIEMLRQEGKLQEWATMVGTAVKDMLAWIESAVVQVASWYTANQDLIKSNLATTISTWSSTLKTLGKVLSVTAKGVELLIKGVRVLIDGFKRDIETITNIWNKVKSIGSGISGLFEKFANKVYDVTVDFKGSGSTTKPITEKIGEISARFAGLEEQINKSNPAVTIKFDQEQLRNFQELGEAARKDSSKSQAEDSFIQAAGKGLAEYVESVELASDTISSAITDGFKTAEDALVEFVTTGKFEIKEFANTAVAEFARIGLQQAVFAPIASGLSGMIRNETGGVYASPPNISKFSNTIVDRPTLFAFSTGAGVMGEGRKHEAILPLTEMASGNLGVEAKVPDTKDGGVDVVIHNYGQSHVSARESRQAGPHGKKQLEIFVTDTVKKHFGISPALRKV